MAHGRGIGSNRWGPRKVGRLGLRVAIVFRKIDYVGFVYSISDSFSSCDVPQGELGAMFAVCFLLLGQVQRLWGCDEVLCTSAALMGQRLHVCQWTQEVVLRNEALSQILVSLTFASPFFVFCPEVSVVKHV